MKANFISELGSLIRKEALLEWRKRYALNGLFLYVLATVFICYLSFREIIDPITWNALLWIIILFGAMNAVAKSFLQESTGRLLYYYSFLDPRVLILAKILYNMGLMLVLSITTLAAYTLFLSNPVQNMPMFLVALVLGSLGFAGILTLMSAIASKAAGSTALMAVLSFPVILPLLLLVIRFSKNAMDGIDPSMNTPYLVMLVALNSMVLALAYILFPYLWRD